MASKPVSIQVPGFGIMWVTKVEDRGEGKKKYHCMAEVKKNHSPTDTETVAMEVWTWPNGGYEVYRRGSDEPYLICDNFTVNEVYEADKK
jgi:hypothetical protein